MSNQIRKHLCKQKQVCNTLSHPICRPSELLHILQRFGAVTAQYSHYGPNRAVMAGMAVLLIAAFGEGVAVKGHEHAAVV